MTTTLRPLRIRLVDPDQVGDLLAFLRERRCIAEQVDAASIDVWPAPLLHLNGNARAAADRLDADELACAACGEAVEGALQRLGSPRCHDCRGGAYSTRPLGAELNGDARHRFRSALRQLQAHLGAWQSADGAAAAIDPL